MTTTRGRIAIVLFLVGAVVFQTTAVGRLRVAAVAPDIVVLALLLGSLRLRTEPALIAGFLAGLAVDAASAGIVGVRAFTYTAVVYVATLTRRRTDLGPFGAVVWAGGLSAGSEALLIAVGAIFGEARPAPVQALQEVFLVGAFNLVVAVVLLPVVARLLGP